VASGRLRLERTLGPLVVSWIERELVHGPGDVQGQRVELDDEQVRFILRAFEIDEHGRRVVRRAVFSRPKGRAKSELLAFIACAEALGPVRFAGWGHDGRPLGHPVQAPLIRLAATEEGQADNSYAPVEFMLREGPISRTPGLDPGMTRTFTPGGGKIVPITAKASSKDGGLESFVGFDETHLYVSAELKSLHATIRRNLGKRKQAQPWSMETSTMYAPEDGSVAESSHRYAEAVAAGAIRDPSFLFDHRQASGKLDFADDDQLRAALVDVYGEAAEWMDIERLLAEARDPDTLESDFRRYFLNQPTARVEGRWITDEKWAECRSEEEIPPAASIVVGVDAAHTRDTTACAWAWRNEDGRIVVRSRVWSVLEGKPHDVFVPGGRLDNDLVTEFIRETLMRDYILTHVFYDPRYFNTQASDLSQEDGLTVVEMHQDQHEMRDAWNDLYDAIHSGTEPTVLHGVEGDAEGAAVLREHVRNVMGVKTERGWKVSKKGDRPFDAVAAMAMARYGVGVMEANQGGYMMVFGADE
jgi:phage terminase large subunit-like protein